MIIKYNIFTPEDDDFLLEIEIDENASFLDLHNAITKACKYNQNEITSFYLSDESWDYVSEILRTRFDEETQADILIMEETKLNHFAPEIGQRYLFVFDEIMQRGFFIEIINIRNAKKNEKLPKTIISGNAPAQYEKIELDNSTKNKKSKNEFDDLFDDFNDFDEFDDFDDFQDGYDSFDDSINYDEY